MALLFSFLLVATAAIGYGAHASHPMDTASDGYEATRSFSRTPAERFRRWLVFWMHRTGQNDVATQAVVDSHALWGGNLSLTVLPRLLAASGGIRMRSSEAVFGGVALEGASAPDLTLFPTPEEADRMRTLVTRALQADETEWDRLFSEAYPDEIWSGDNPAGPEVTKKGVSLTGGGKPIGPDRDLADTPDTNLAGDPDRVGPARPRLLPAIIWAFVCLGSTCACGVDDYGCDTRAAKTIRISTIQVALFKYR